MYIKRVSTLVLTLRYYCMSRLYKVRCFLILWFLDESIEFLSSSDYFDKFENCIILHINSD